MLVDFFNRFEQKAYALVLLLYGYIFPEYPQIGLAVFITAAILFAYYMAKGTASVATKMALSSLVTLSFLLYVIHCLIKIYHVAV